MFYFKLAIKSIFERHQQYKSLFLVSAVGICLMLSAIMITDGMIDSMNEKARQYFKDAGLCYPISKQDWRMLIIPC